MGWPNVRAALQTYLRDNAPLRASIGNRVFYGVPKKGTRYPLITLPGQVGGGRDPGEAPIDRPLHQLDILGDLNGGYDAMLAVESLVRDAFDAIRTPTTVGTVVLCGVAIIGAVDAPDEADRPRRVLTLDVTARAA